MSSSPRLLENDTLFGVMEARRVHMKHYDPRSDMATFDIKDIHLHSTDRVLAEILIVFELLRQVLGEMYLLRLWESDAETWCTTVGVLGSSALLTLETIMKRDSKHKFRGRWKDSPPCFWATDNVNVFVCGGARDPNPHRFRFFCMNFGRILRRKCQDLGYRIENELDWSGSSRPSPFTNSREVRFSFFNLGVTLNLTEARWSANVYDIISTGAVGASDEVAERRGMKADINVAAVAYNPVSGFLHAPLDTVKSIETGTAIMRDVVDMEPSTQSVASMCSTLKRITKYQRYGYRFHRFSVTSSQDG